MKSYFGSEQVSSISVSAVGVGEGDPFPAEYYKAKDKQNSVEFLKSLDKLKWY